VQAASQDELGKLTLTSERMAWPLQIATADRWCGPGWVLAGDAAHSVHPLAGQGLNLGLADAECWRRCCTAANTGAAWAT
jgi:2-polyprenyl-6-methoxyphenol hydroxylase-like FAD-dependent oxidoreductase